MSPARTASHRTLSLERVKDGIVYRATVPGSPVPKARARVYTTRRGEIRAVTPARTRDAEDEMGWLLKMAWRQEADASAQFGVRCRFVFSRTVAGDERRVDGDNCLKAALDAGNGVVWADDRQVRHAEYDVQFGDEPRAEIEFWRLKDG